MLILVLLAGAFSGSVAHRASQLRERYEIIRRLKLRDYTIETRPIPNAWFWRPLVGDAAVFARMIRLTRSRNDPVGSDPTPKDISLLRYFPDVETLVLQGPAVTDESIQVLITMHRIETLGLIRTGMTDDGLALIAKCSTLESFGIEGDEECAVGSRVTARGIAKNVPHLKKLYDVSFSFVDFDDQALAAICRQNSALENLGLQRARITDLGLREITLLPILAKLCIFDTQGVTDDGILCLRFTRRLQHLTLEGTSVSVEGARRLWRQMPTLDGSPESALRILPGPPNL